MMRALVSALILAAFCAPAALAQSAAAQPRIGYIYPAGGRQGASVEILIGGQVLRGVTGAYVTGGGVRALSVRFMGRPMNLMKEERVDLFTRLAPVLEQHGMQMPPAVRRFAQESARPAAKAAGGAKQAGTAGADDKEAAQTRSHPLLDNIEDLSKRELEFVITEFVQFSDKKQPNTQIADTVFLELEIDSNAEPGERELRLVTAQGLSNPMRFRVGAIGEVSEPLVYRGVLAAAPEPLKPPVLLNGQVRPGEIDRWRISARKGQRLVISAEARSLNPYLADAVPGWFQAVLALYNEKGREVAFADDYRFDPDPVLLYEVPETGAYKLEVRDAIYRGRQDFVYRVSVSEKPFVETVFPLGGRYGHRTLASVSGWNLGGGSLVLDTGPGPDSLRESMLQRSGMVSNAVSYAVDDLPEIDEREPNGPADAARAVDLPLVVNGRVSAAGDVDVFQFKGRRDEEVVAEVFARRLGSPLDSVLRLTDVSGKVVAWNDDAEDKDGVLYRDIGVLTHHADSYVRAKLPADGIYNVRIWDAQDHGGPEYGYRLRLRPPAPDFELAVTPSSVNVIGGSLAPLRVHALRRDGFDGDVEIALADAPAGFAIQGGLIPAGCTSICVTLAAPPRAAGGPVSLRFTGRAVTGGREMVREAVPCEDMMQAFLYRHLVPSKELVVAVIGRGGRLAPPSLMSDVPMRIRPGGEATVRVALPMRPFVQDMELVLNEGPEGLTVESTVFAEGSVTLQFKADAQKVEPGAKGNLIVEGFVERAQRRRDSGRSGQTRRVSIGVLPAIPFEILKSPAS